MTDAGFAATHDTGAQREGHAVTASVRQRSPQADPPSRPTSQGKRPRLTPRGRRIRAGILAVLTVLVLTIGVSVGGALTAPGTDSTAARLAEWARTHGLGAVVTYMEQEQYQLTKPKLGGTVAGGIPRVSQAQSAVHRVHGFSRPANLHPLVGAPLPGEGVWQPLLQAHGQTAAWVTFLRPDAVHTSYLVSVVWMNPRLLRFVQHPGYQVPGDPLTGPDELTQAERSSVLATFNSGFQMVDAQGGYWQNGTTVAPLVTGAASMVLSRSGTFTVERWPGGSPSTGTAAVRQNLSLLIDHGSVSPLVHSGSTRAWGKTVGNAAYVWRSAVATRTDGADLFVVGPAMSVSTLADVLQAAGASEAMELDINRDWTNFLTYTHPRPGAAEPHKLTADMRPNPYRYLNPSTRDFVAVLPR